MTLKDYGNKPPQAKLIALIIKTITGILGASSILTNQHPFVSLSILCIGAATNEVINFYKWDK